MIRNAVARVKRYESLINIRNQGGTAEFSSLARDVFLFDRKLLYFLSNKNPPGDARSRDKKMSLMRPRSAREFRERNSLFSPEPMAMAIRELPPVAKTRAIPYRILTRG